MSEPSPPPEPSIMAVGLRGLCPRCGAPTLFGGFIRFADRCRACGLDLAGFNVGDGAAALLTLVIGTIVCIAAIVVELTLHPPIWVHVLLWLPITIGLVLGSLRMAKAVLLASEYRNRAHEGRLIEREPRP